MRNRVWVVMSLLGWGGPADVVPWIAGDDSCVGDACTVLSDCDAGAVVKMVDFSYKPSSAIPEDAV